MSPIISIVGKSKSGKTTLISKLIPELKKRGYRIGVIKHAFHKFEIDKKGKDSWQHKEAGAETVVVSSPGRVTMVKDSEDETLDSLHNKWLFNKKIEKLGFLSPKSYLVHCPSSLSSDYESAYSSSRIYLLRCSQHRQLN